MALRAPSDEGGPAPTRHAEVGRGGKPHALRRVKDACAAASSGRFAILDPAAVVWPLVWQEVLLERRPRAGGALSKTSCAPDAGAGRRSQGAEGPAEPGREAHP